MNRALHSKFIGALVVLASLGAALLLATPATGRHGAAMRPLDPPAIVINEVLAHADAPYVDAVELYNPGDNTVDLTGWLLTDNTTRPTSEWVQFPAGAQLRARDYYVIADFDDDWPFGLSEAGDSVFIFQPDPLGGAPRQVAAVRFTASPRNVSFTRYVDTTGRTRFPLQAGPPTLGAHNCGVRISPVQLEEIMVDPADGESEYVVIANTSAEAVELYDPNHPTNTWKLVGQNSNGKDNDMFFLPQWVLLGPGERIILSEIEPARFREEQKIPANVRIFGPLASGLSSTGERVALAAPLEPELDAKINYAFVDEVEYSNQPPWPSVAENGKALVRIDARRYANDVANWRAAAALETIRGGAATATAMTPGGLPRAASDLYLPFVSNPLCAFN